MSDASIKLPRALSLGVGLGELSKAVVQQQHQLRVAQERERQPRLHPYRSGEDEREDEGDPDLTVDPEAEQCHWRLRHIALSKVRTCTTSPLCFSSSSALIFLCLFSLSPPVFRHECCDYNA